MSIVLCPKISLENFKAIVNSSPSKVRSTYITGGGLPPLDVEVGALARERYHTVPSSGHGRLVPRRRPASRFGLKRHAGSAPLHTSSGFDCYHHRLPMVTIWCILIKTPC